MQTVAAESANKLERQAIDYEKLTNLYNGLDIGMAVKMEKVYNITLFKRTISNRGVASEVDFQAYNRGDNTFVKRLTQVAMTKG